MSEEEKQAMKMADYQPFGKVTNHTPQIAYERVLDYAGASLRRDEIDQRVVEKSGQEVLLIKVRRCNIGMTKEIWLL